MSTNTELRKHLPPTFRTPGSLPDLFFRCKRLNLYRWGQLSGEQKLKSPPCLDPPVAHRASRTKSPPPRAPHGYQIVHALTLPLMYSVLQTPGLLSAAGSFSWPFCVYLGFLWAPGLAKVSATLISAHLCLALSWSSRALLPAFCSRLRQVLLVC